MIDKEEETKLKISNGTKGIKKSKNQGIKLSILNLGSGNPNAKYWLIINHNTGEQYQLHGNLESKCKSKLELPDFIDKNLFDDFNFKINSLTN